MRLTISKTAQKELDAFDAKGFPPYFCETLLPFMRDHLLACEKAHTFTLRNEDHVIAVGGFVMLWEGVAEVWVAIQDKEFAKRHLRKVITAFQSMLDAVATSSSIRRLQCTVLADHLPSQRFIEALGFDAEGVLEGYGIDGSDHILYSRLFV